MWVVKRRRVPAESRRWKAPFQSLTEAPMEGSFDKITVKTKVTEASAQNKESKTLIKGKLGIRMRK